ncbi:MAG: helix-turn-helix domain-containing protein [Anaerolineae bacterium]
MGELGQLLREARERKGVSPAEVEAATKIRQKYVIALEEGNYDQLPPGVYVRGFLRSLAAYLGLDAEEVIALYGKEVPQEAAPRPTRFLSQPLTTSSWLTPDLLAGIVLLLAIGVLGVWIFREYIAPLAQVTPTPTVEAMASAPPPTSTATAIPSPTGTLQPQPTPTSPPSQALAAGSSPTQTVAIGLQALATTPSPTPQGITLQVEVTERAWLRVVADGQTVFEGILDRGATRTWRGQEQIAMRSGNAGGVLVTVNGQREGPLGGRGEVVDREWRLTEEGVVVITPERPTPTD